MTITVTAAIFLSALLAGCQTAQTRQEAERSVAATWSEGWVSIPSRPGCGFALIGRPQTEKDCLAAGVPDASAPVPAVVFLHGCLGWNGRQARVMELIKKNGYVVFSPNSFARPGREPECGQGFHDKVRMRLEEARYAVAQIRKLSWIDPSRLVLAGFSEGGLAAAQYSGNDFRSVLVLGWGCGRGSINAPSHVPVLNIVGRHDAETRHGAVLCSVTGRPGSEAVHVDAGHDVAGDPAASHRIKAFLSRVL